MAALRLLGAQWKVSVCSKRTYPKGTLGCRRFLLRIWDWATPWHTRMSHDNSSYIIIKNLYYMIIGYIWIYLVYSKYIHLLLAVLSCCAPPSSKRCEASVRLTPLQRPTQRGVGVDRLRRAGFGFRPAAQERPLWRLPGHPDDPGCHMGCRWS